MKNVLKAQEEAHKRYEEKCKHFMMRLRLDTDADILEWISNQTSANASIKALIRSDICKKYNSEK